MSALVALEHTFCWAKRVLPAAPRWIQWLDLGSHQEEDRTPSRCFESLTPSLQPFSWQEREEKPGKVEFSKGISWSDELDFLLTPHCVLHKTRFLNAFNDTNKCWWEPLRLHRSQWGSANYSSGASLRGKSLFSSLKWKCPEWVEPTKDVPGEITAASWLWIIDKQHAVELFTQTSRVYIKKCSPQQGLNRRYRD